MRAARAFLPPRRAALRSPRPRISICLAARDEIHAIRTFLHGVSIQDYSAYECLVFDDGSSDGTAEIAREWARRFAKIRLIRPTKSDAAIVGRSEALDVLARAAQGDALLFLGARHRLRRESLGALAECWQACQAQALNLYCLGAAESAAQKLFGGFREHRLMVCSPLAQPPDRDDAAALEGGALLIARDAYLEAQGYSAGPAGWRAEIELIRRLKTAGKRVCLIDARAMAPLERPRSLGGLFASDRRALWRFATPAQRWGWMAAGTLGLHALPWGCLIGFLAFGSHGLATLGSSAALAALGWAGRWAAWRPFRSSRLGLYLHPLLVAYETALALDLLLCALRRRLPEWKGRIVQ